MIQKLKKFDDEVTKTKRKICLYKKKLPNDPNGAVPPEIDFAKYVKTHIHKTLISKNYNKDENYNYYELIETLFRENMTKILNKFRENFDLNKVNNINQILNYAKKVVQTSVGDYVSKKMRHQNKDFSVISLEASKEKTGFEPSNQLIEKSCEEKVIKRDKLQKLKNAINALESPGQKTVINYYYYENLKLTEIADKMNKTPQAVSNQLQRAYKNLRKKLTA